MTVLKSLLSSFRRSRIADRRSRRSDGPSSVSTEALEPRLLLTNPFDAASLPGAPVTIYLDFDGHTETSAEWRSRHEGMPANLVVPEFDLDGNAGFSSDEVNRAREIYERVAEDFRPFNINVTTILPVGFDNAEDIFVSIGGDGSGLTNPGRYSAISESFARADLPQTVFAHSSNHSGLGGDFEYNVANSVSQSVAVAFGLQVHRETTGVAIEGDNDVAPILGDSIIGDDNLISNPNSQRDIWVLAPGNDGTTLQDDLAVIVSNPNVEYRADDHGSTLLAATGITVGAGVESVTAVIEQNSDVDIFSFTTAATFATISVTTTDLRSAPFNAITPGSNLDPLLVIRDAGGNVVATEDGPGLSSTISVNLPSGTYFVEVSGDGEYGNLGEYTLSLGGVGAIPSFANPVAFNSNPSGTVDLYLAFAGALIPSDSPFLDSRVAGRGDFALSSYDTDGNFASFSATELAEIEEIWARVSEDFRPFNVNVTTVRPANLDDGSALQVTIGGDGAIIAGPDYFSLTGAYSDGAVPNVAAVFPEVYEAGDVDDARNTAWRTSAAFAQMLGLDNHAEYDVGGAQLSGRDPGNAQTGPILGQPENSLRDIWVNAPNTVDSGTLQDDLALIDAAANIDFRVDDVRDLPGFATPITIRTGDDIVTGVIERNDDVDFWSFDTLATTATITVSGLNLIDGNPSLTNPGSNLDPTLQLIDGTGAIVAFSDEPFVAGDPNSLTASVTETLAAGTYFIRVSNRGEYGNLGEYTVTLQGVDSNPVTVAIAPDTFVETDGVQTGVGTVSRPAGELFGPEITVWLQSQDESEVTVPQSVVIPASESSVSFDITIVDDTLLDGNQLVEIQALIPNPAFPDRNDPAHLAIATLNGSDFVTVSDHEEITVTVDPNSVSEDAGFVDVTVTRSNTDTEAPNHYVSTSNSQLLEFTSEGVQVATIQVPWHSGAVRPVGELIHDVEVLEDGRVVVFNGSTSVALSVYNPNTGLWQHVGPFVGLSTDSADASTGGLSSVGNFVFLTDLEAFDGDTHGMMRVDLGLLTDPLYDAALDDFDIATDNGFLSIVEGFGAGTLGSRFFGLPFTGGGQIRELNPSTGEQIQLIDLPLIPGTPFQYDALSLAFDGEFLWVLVDRGRSGFDPELIKIDPNTGELLEEHGLSGLFSNTTFNGPESIAYLDGLIYISEEFPIFGFTPPFTEAYDPVARRVTGNIIFPESDNNLSLSTVLTGIQGTGLLAALGVQAGGTTRQIFEFRADDGIFVDSLLVQGTTTAPFFFDDNLAHIRDVTFGDTTFDDLYLVEQSNTSVDVFDRRTGQLVDTDPSTALIDPLTIPSIAGGFTAADVPGVSSRRLFFRDSTVGFDGLLYGLEETGDRVSVHDPVTLQRVRGIELATTVNTISVADDSGVYGGGAGGLITHFDFDGNVISTLDTALGLVVDIDVNVGGEILFSDAGGVVAQTSQTAVAEQDLSGVTTLEDVGANAFVSFGRHSSQSTGDVVVRLSSSDLTELQVPDSVVIPRGQQSVTIQVPVIDDAARDGDQAVFVDGTSPEYSQGVLLDGDGVRLPDVIVRDAEQIGVEIAPTEVEETAVVVPDSVTVFRTDVEGPLEFISTNTYSNSTSVPIVDRDVTISRITVTDQVSFLQDVNVNLSLQHDSIPDLDVFLIGPDGTRVELFSDLSSNESNLTNTTLDDESGVRIVEAAAPFTGSFSPEQSLENFDGLNPSGVWTLEIIDDSASDAGVLLDWSIELMTIGLAEMQVTLDITNSDEASVPVVVTIPANQASVTLPLDVFDDEIVDGTQTVDITVASSSDEAGFQLVGDSVDVLDVEFLTVALSGNSVQENAGAGALTGTITRVDTNGPLTVTLTSSDMSEIAVSSSVTFPDGDATVSFGIDVIDDALFDGDQQVTISLQAPGYSDVTTEVITVTDEEPRLRLTTIDAVLSEADGTALFTIARLDVEDLSQPLDVALTSSDLSELSVPLIVTIPIGEISRTFQAIVVDDDLVDGNQSVTITAADANTGAPVVNSTTLDVVVADAESVNLVIDGPNAFAENVGDAATTITVSVTSVGHTEPIVVTLTNSDDSELSIPATVLIPVGESSVSFEVDAVNDGELDGDQVVNISAVAANHEAGAVQITVLDHEPPILSGPAFDIVDPTPALTWESLAGATRYDLWVNDVSRGIVQLFRLEDLPAINPDGNGFESFVPTQELGVGIYRFWVRAYDSLERPAAWSTARTFRIRTAPVITSPSNTGTAASGAFPDINWTSVVDTDRYDLWINNETTGESEVVREVDLQTTNFATATAGLSGGTYRAWVRAIAPDGVTGFWSESVRFTVLSTPQVLAPTGSTFDRTPEIRWDSVEGASFYDVWVSRQYTGQPAVVVLRDQFVEGTSTSPTMDLEDGIHVVWVRAIAADGSATPWSQPQRFEIAGAPRITTPFDNTTSTEPPVVSWTGVNQAVRHEVWVANSENQRVYFNTEVTANSVAIPDEIGFGTFRVWVRAVSDRGEFSAWSRPVTFTVVSTDQASPVDLLTPDTLLTEFRILVDPIGATQPRPVEAVEVNLPAEEMVEATVVSQDQVAPSAPAAMVQKAEAVTDTAELIGVDHLMSDWDAAVLTLSEEA
ncbi:MAG: proprotein convertase P-domain-containing protein [Fuerstiella sp.]